jgi:hypothetical protein
MRTIAGLGQSQRYALVPDVLTLNGEETLMHDLSSDGSPRQGIL